MPNEDNDCIRYLMKEMDPSEELLMEQAMMEDEDLLIEVESMRQTLQKLDRLPEKEPPSKVTDDIMEKAAEQAEKNRQSSRKVTPILRYAVAATLALTVTAGGMWFYMGTDTKQNNSQGVQAASSPAAFNNNPAATTGNEATSVNQTLRSSFTSATSEVEPWVDRDDILRFEEQYSNQDSGYQALIRNATQKLQLIEQPTMGANRVNSLQLTGN